MPASADTTATVPITVNGEARTVPDGQPLIDLLRDLGIDPEATQGVAVAVNMEVVRRPEWPGVTLAEGDEVEIIQAQQGG
jgi:sulfur carrier protein